MKIGTVWVASIPEIALHSLYRDEPVKEWVPISGVIGIKSAEPAEIFRLQIYALFYLCSTFIDIESSGETGSIWKLVVLPEILYFVDVYLYIYFIFFYLPI